jgi:hypothetical protein
MLLRKADTLPAPKRRYPGQNPDAAVQWRGDVQSWAEREEVEEATRAAPGREQD